MTSLQIALIVFIPILFAAVFLVGFMMGHLSGALEEQIRDAERRLKASRDRLKVLQGTEDAPR